MKYQVIIIEKNYAGTHNFEELKPAVEMFKIFTEEETARRRDGLKIIQKIYLTENERIRATWE